MEPQRQSILVELEKLNADIEKAVSNLRLLQLRYSELQRACSGLHGERPTLACLSYLQ